MTEPDKHHPSLYYEDGNVVLSALRRDGERQYFRVHQSILSKHSPVLGDMLSMPPLKAFGSANVLEEAYGGVVHVQMPDSGEDLESFLQVLYDPLYVV